MSDTKYKIYDGESPSMASNYINYFLENKYNCSLPRSISKDTLFYLRAYILDNYRVSGNNLVKGIGEEWINIEVNDFHSFDNGYLSINSLDKKYSVYVLYQDNEDGNEKEVYSSPTNLSSLAVSIRFYKNKKYKDVQIVGVNESGQGIAGTIITMNGESPVYSEILHTFSYKKLDQDIKDDEDSYLMVIDSAGHGYVDRRILQYLLGYAITENSSYSEICYLQSLIYKLDDKLNLVKYTSKFTKGQYDENVEFT